MPIKGLILLTDIQQKRIYEMLKSKKRQHPESDSRAYKIMQELL